MRTTPAKQLEGKNAQATAYAYLKDKILGGQLSGGTSISPTETGELLGISRMPVREALLQLEAEGLIRFGSNRRPIVTALTPSEIMELFEIRIALEQLAILRATPKIKAHIFSDLSQHLLDMDRAKTDPHTWLKLHDEFHERIYAEAEMPKLMEEIKRLRDIIRPYLLMYTSFFEQPEVPGYEHSTLLEVLKKGDTDAAQMAIAKHIRAGAANLVYFLMNGKSPQQLIVVTGAN
jgi:DNA-binding GntR family transcriptional regulator